MMKRLVFVHGRSQEKKNSAALKAQWIAAFSKGLAKSGLQLPISEKEIKFPYYGQTLYDLIANASADKVAEIVVRGAANDRESKVFVENILNDVLKKAGISEAQVAKIAGGNVRERGLQNKKWVLGLFRAIDKYMPFASGASIALITNDVYQYLRNPGLRDAIEEGVRGALSDQTPMIIVGHSLGSVVCYNMLRRDGKRAGWQVPLLLTLGSPLGISMIRDSLAPIRAPEGVRSWVNAFDPADAVALHALDKLHFKVSPPIENLRHVRNGTDNRHGIAGYLDDKIVAKRIYDALTT